MIYGRCGRGRGRRWFASEVAPLGRGYDGRARASPVGPARKRARSAQEGWPRWRARPAWPSARCARDETRLAEVQRPRTSSGSRRSAGLTVRGGTPRGVAGAGEARRPDRARRPGVAAALNVQEHAHACPRSCSCGMASGSVTRRCPSCCAITATARAPNKSVEGAQHPDRNAQFEHINARRRRTASSGTFRSSPSTHKKKRAGRQLQETAGVEWQPCRPSLTWWTSTTCRIRCGRLKAIPYGVYDLAATGSGFVSVGVDHDTPVFSGVQ